MIGRQCPCLFGPLPRDVDHRTAPPRHTTARSGKGGAGRIADEGLSDNRELLTGFVRALAGALLFSMPLLMTMEMWHLAVAVERWRLIVLAVAGLALTLGLTHQIGAMGADGGGWSKSVVDTGVAVVAGAVVALLVLTVFGVIQPTTSWSDAMSVVAVEALPASLGAAFARTQLGQASADPPKSGYGRELFLMLAGAVIFASAVAPTEEVVLIAARMSDWSGVVVLVLSVGLLHTLVYTAGFAGQEDERPREALLYFTLPGYAIALAASGFMLWTFGRLEDSGATIALAEAVVLALPASLGAGAARLVL